MISDSHCHLDYSNLYDQLDEVIERANINKVKYLLTICTTLDSFNKIKLIIIGRLRDVHFYYGSTLAPANHPSAMQQKPQHQQLIEK